MHAVTINVIEIDDDEFPVDNEIILQIDCETKSDAQRIADYVSAACMTVEK